MTNPLPMPNNNKIRCLLVDDEPLAREVLKQHLSKVDALELAGTCANAMEAIDFLQKHHIDLLFLDIQMPQLLGTTFIRTLKNPPKVIFTTAFRKYAVEGFELDAVDYLLKPISFERFLKAVNKILQSDMAPDGRPLPPLEKPASAPVPFLYFRVNKKMVKVLINDILYIESLKDYIRIVTDNRTVITKYVLSALEEILPHEEFLRIHKSYIVAIRKIDSYKTDTIEIGDHELPVGRLFKHDVSRVLNASSAT
jgi:DNA-binding LytR/AlgR family response regulator